MTVEPTNVIGLPIHVANLQKLLRTIKEDAVKLDHDHPCNTRSEFIIPSVADLREKSSNVGEANGEQQSETSTYLCGNSLGVQPRAVAQYVAAQLNRWSTKGVYGHFKHVECALIPPWLDLDDAVQEETAKIVGAQPSEVVVMGTLTANLHLLMSSFYRPTSKRFKIIFEERAFPSDHFVVESQVAHHGFDPADAMVLIKPPGSDTASPLLPTEHILSVIDAHASETAVLLLPGIQYYTGQLFDIETITAYAKERDITVGWDLAHAVGNVPLNLHDCNVDFAVWCNYKYMNCGPGATGGLFVHSTHTAPSPAPADASTNGADDSTPTPQAAYRPARLAGWWGSSKATRFTMDNVYTPIPGAAGFQLSNPSALDLSAVLASLSVFAQTDMRALRQRSLRLTRFLEQALDAAGARLCACAGADADAPPYEIITPREPERRGAQLSVRLARAGMMDAVMRALEDAGVVIDERKPDVVRVAPAPLYNTYGDVARFVEVFAGACLKAMQG